MPWTATDARKHIDGLSPKQMDAWAKIANSSLAACIKGGKSQGECEGSAIKIANARAKMTESVDLSFTTPILEASILDATKGIYEITLIQDGLTGDKKRYYPAATLVQALPLFEGAQAYADHPTRTEMKERPERSIRDLIGYYESARIDRTGGRTKIKARLNTLESAAWIRPLLNMAVSNRSLCGASIHAGGSIQPKAKDGADLVESIDDVFSTDIVTKPNAGGTIERLIASEREGGEEMNFSKLTIADIAKERPELIEAMKKDVLEAAEKEAKEAAEKNGEQKSDIAESYESLRASHEALIIKMKIAESSILEAIKDAKDVDLVAADLTLSMQGKTEEEMDKFIESHKVFLKGIGAKVINPAKEDQSDTGYNIGSLLPEAKRAYEKLNLRS